MRLLFKSGYYYDESIGRGSPNQDKLLIIEAFNL